MELSENVRETKEGAADSDEEIVCEQVNNLHMFKITYRYDEDNYSTSSDGSLSNCHSPIPDDANSKFSLTKKKHFHWPFNIQMTHSFSIFSFPNGSNRFTGTWLHRSNQSRLFNTRNKFITLCIQYVIVGSKLLCGEGIVKFVSHQRSKRKRIDGIQSNIRST